MNWYKKIKISFPVVEDEKQYPGYTDIGHDYLSDDKLWLIDNQWKLLTRITTDYYDDHGQWDKFIEDDMISYGRYDAANHMASIIVVADVNFVSPKYRYIINRTSKILDKAFNNPRIFIYT